MEEELQKIKKLRFDTPGSIELLRKAIKKKFGTYARFCRCAHYDLYELNKLFRLADSLERNQRLCLVRVLVEMNDSHDTPGVELLEVERESIKEALKKWPTIKDFCREYPWYTETWVSALICGKIKRRSKRVTELARSLFLDLDEIILANCKTL